MSKGRPRLNLEHTLHFSVDSETKERFVNVADSMSANRSSLLRALLTDWLSKFESTEAQ